MARSGLKVLVAAGLLLAACSPASDNAASPPTTVKDPSFANTQAQLECLDKLENGGTSSCPSNSGGMLPDGAERFCGSLTDDAVFGVVEFSEMIPAAMKAAYGRFPGVDAFVESAGPSVISCVLKAPAPALPTCKRGQTITVLVSADAQRNLTLPCGAKAASPY